MKIGTRGSDLALWQARRVRALLREVLGVESELVIIKTSGDADHDTPFAGMTGKGFFTKEIEDALIAGDIDVAVHSLKDLQTAMPQGLTLAAVLERADRRDVLLTRSDAFSPELSLRLKSGAKVGTSSARRIEQLRFLRPDLVLEPLRGNVPTRVRKLRDGRYDAILVAAAGLDRLELPLDDFHAYRLPESLFVPAPAQGVLGIQIRDNDEVTKRAVTQLDSASLREIVDLEREVLRRLEGGCQLALGTAADKTDHGYRLTMFLGTGVTERPRRVVVNGVDRKTMVGAVVGYAKREHARPISHPATVWITREPERAGEFVSALPANRFAVEQIPVLSAIATGDTDEKRHAVANLESYDWVMFTSQTAVHEFKMLMDQNDASWSGSTRCAAVGRKTARAMKELGWAVDFIGDVADAVSLSEQFMREHEDALGRVLFPCGASAGDDLEAGLASAKKFERLVCYDMVPHPRLKSAVADAGQPDVVVYTSPQAARYLFAQRQSLKDTLAVAIGTATSEALLSLGCTLVYEALDRSLEGTAEVIDGLFTA